MIDASERLDFRMPALEDRPYFERWLTDGQTVRYLLARRALTPAEIRQLIAWMIGRWRRGFGFAIIVRRHDGEPIGYAGLKRLNDWPGAPVDPRDDDGVEIGFVLDAAARGRGYATEAARSTIAFGFRALPVGEIFGRCARENRASRAVLERCGMRFVGEERVGEQMAQRFAIPRAGGVAP